MGEAMHTMTAIKNHSTQHTFTLPEERFEHVHLDIVGPLPSSQGFGYILTMIDQFTRWPEATSKRLQ